MGMPQIVTKVLTTASSIIVASSQAVANGSAVTLNGSAVVGGVATLDTQRRVLFSYAAGSSAAVFAIKGTNQFGNPIGESVTTSGSSANATASSLDYLTVTQILISGSSVSITGVGTNGVGSSPWLSANTMVTPENFNWTCTISGSASYAIETTNDPVNTIGLISSVVPTAWPVTGLSSVSANAQAAATYPFAWWRLTITGSSGSVSATGIQAGIFQ